MNIPERIESGMQTALRFATANGCPPKLARALRHAVFPGGARIRPRLCLAVAESVILVGGLRGDPYAHQRAQAGNQVERRIRKASEHGSRAGTPCRPGLEGDKQDRHGNRGECSTARKERPVGTHAITDTAMCCPSHLLNSARTCGDHASVRGGRARIPSRTA